MIGMMSPYVASLERFLRIEPEMDAVSRLRARVIYMSSFGYLLLLVSYLAYLMVRFDGFAIKRPIIAASCVLMLCAVVAVRWIKSPTFFGLFFTAFPLTSVWMAAKVSVAAKASPILGGGIHTPTLPILCVGVVLAAMVGTRLTVALYGVLCLALIAALNRTSLGLITDPSLTVITDLRTMQITVGVTLLGLTAFVLSRLAYASLAKLEGALDHTKRAEGARKELLATMSHEIRTPLNGIISVTDMLQKKDHDDATQSYVDIISVSAGNLLEIVNDSLDRARSEYLGETQDLDNTICGAFSPTDTINHVCTLFSAQALDKGLWLGTHNLDALPESVSGDAARLRQVLSNLVGNAVKFTHQGGIRIGARLIDHDGGTVRIQFYVQDTGVGIEKEAQSRIFERFGQSASSLTTSVKGTGLGLAIARDLVESMGGTLQIDSNPGSGTTFHFTLPLFLNEDAPSHTEPLRQAAI